MNFSAITLSQVQQVLRIENLELKKKQYDMIQNIQTFD